MDEALERQSAPRVRGVCHSWRYGTGFVSRGDHLFEASDADLRPGQRRRPHANTEVEFSLDDGRPVDIVCVEYAARRRCLRCGRSITAHGRFEWLCGAC